MPLRVLLAEDNPVNQRVAVGMLRRLGAEVAVVGDGRQAVDAVLAAPGGHDLVLLDGQMPVLDGWAAAAELRAREDPTRRAHVVALTASTMRADRDRAEAVGMDGRLAKPLQLQELAELLEGVAARLSKVS